MRIQTRPIEDLLKEAPLSTQVRCHAHGDHEYFHAVLPLPPSVNRLYEHHRGRKVTSEVVRQYKKQVAELMARSGIRPLPCPLVATVRLWRPGTKGDTDNYLKVLFDSLNGFAYHDDEQICDEHVYRRTDRHNPRCEITLTPWKDDANGD